MSQNNPSQERTMEEYWRLYGITSRRRPKTPALSTLRRLIRQDRADANRELYDATVGEEMRRIAAGSVRWAIGADVVTIPGELLDVD